MAPVGSARASATLPRQGKAGRPIASGVTPEYVWAAQLTTAGERGAVYGERMTPRRLALDAARLMLQQDLWGRATSSSGVFGKLTVLGSLCVAAGGNYREDGNPGPPDEPHAATVLATTCALLAGNFVGEPVHGRDCRGPAGWVVPGNPGRTVQRSSACWPPCTGCFICLRVSSRGPSQRPRRVSLSDKEVISFRVCRSTGAISGDCLDGEKPCNSRGFHRPARDA